MSYILGFTQIWQLFSPEYRANNTTNKPAAISAGVLGLIAAWIALKGGMTAENATALIGTAIASGASVGGGIKHLYDQWLEKKKAAAKEATDGAVDTTGWAKTQPAPEPSDAPVDISLDKNAVCVNWTDKNGKLRTLTPAQDKPLFILVTVYEAVQVTLADGRVWAKQ